MSPATPAHKIVIPDLVTYCTFKKRVNRHTKQVTTETKQWLFKGGNLTGKKRDSFRGLKASLLTAMTCSGAAFPQFRVCNDFLAYSFYPDNLSDDMDNQGTRTVADAVLNSLYHPHTYNSPERVGKMTRE